MNSYNVRNGTYAHCPRYDNAIPTSPDQEPYLLICGNDEVLYALRTYNETPRYFYAKQHGEEVHFLGNPPHEVIDCLAEVRNAKEDVARARPVRLPKGVQLDDTQLGCPDDIAQQLGCEQFARTTAPGESKR